MLLSNFTEPYDNRFMVHYSAFLFNVIVLGWFLIISCKFVTIAVILIYVRWDEIPLFVGDALSVL